jgi:hypothetical protein
MGQKKKDKQKESNMLRKGRVKRGKTTKGKTTKGKTTKGKTTKGKTTKGKTTKGKMAKGKATKGKMAKGKMTKGKMAKGNMAGSNKRKFGTHLNNVPLAEIRDTDNSRTIKMDYSKITLDTIQLPDYVMRSTKFFDAVEDYIIDHYSFLDQIPGSNPTVDAYDNINECYVDVKVTTKYTTGRTVLTSEGQMNYLADQPNVGYYLIIRSNGSGKNMYDVELLLCVPLDEGSDDDDRSDQYADKLKRVIKESRSTSRTKSRKKYRPTYV